MQWIHHISEDFLGLAIPGPGIPDLAVDVAVHCKGVGLDDL